ncbi:MAG: hypothetical protein ACMG6E_07400 [Candidatus Roizmanbacteria bacterium]
MQIQTSTRVTTTLVNQGLLTKLNQSSVPSINPFKLSQLSKPKSNHHNSILNKAAIDEKP